MMFFLEFFLSLEDGLDALPQGCTFPIARERKVFVALYPDWDSEQRVPSIGLGLNTCPATRSRFKLLIDPCATVHAVRNLKLNRNQLHQTPYMYLQVYRPLRSLMSKDWLQHP